MNPELLNDEQKMIKEMADRIDKDRLLEGYRERA